MSIDGVWNGCPAVRADAVSAGQGYIAPQNCPGRWRNTVKNGVIALTSDGARSESTRSEWPCSCEMLMVGATQIIHAMNSTVRQAAPYVLADRVGCGLPHRMGRSGGSRYRYAMKSLHDLNWVEDARETCNPLRWGRAPPYTLIGAVGVGLCPTMKPLGFAPITPDRAAFPPAAATSP